MYTCAQVGGRLHPRGRLLDVPGLELQALDATLRAEESSGHLSKHAVDVWPGERCESRQLKLRGGRLVDHVANDLGVVLDELARRLQPRRQTMARRDAGRLLALRLLAQSVSGGDAWGAGAALGAGRCAARGRKWGGTRAGSGNVWRDLGRGCLSPLDGEGRLT